MLTPGGLIALRRRGMIELIDPVTGESRFSCAAGVGFQNGPVVCDGLLATLTGRQERQPRSPKERLPESRGTAPSVTFLHSDAEPRFCSPIRYANARLVGRYDPQRRRLFVGPSRTRPGEEGSLIGLSIQPSGAPSLEYLRVGACLAVDAEGGYLALGLSGCVHFPGDGSASRLLELDELPRSAAFDQAGIAFVASKRALSAHAPSGQQIFSVDAGSEITCGPIIAPDSSVLIATRKGFVFRID